MKTRLGGFELSSLTADMALSYMPVSVRKGVRSTYPFKSIRARGSSSIMAHVMFIIYTCFLGVMVIVE